MQKRAILPIISLMCLSFAPAANAANEVWSDWERVATLEPTVKGWVWIYLKDGVTVNCGTTTGQSTANPFLAYSSPDTNFPAPGNGGFDRTYSALLTAMMADREVRFRLSPSTDGAYCFVERILIR